jgi:hypothetical protein
MIAKEERTVISHVVAFGDSLTDRQTANNRYIAGFISYGYLAGLGKSSNGRFTNGFTWCDHALAILVEKFLIQELEAKGASQEEIADAVALHRKEVERLLQEFTLGNDREVLFEGHKLLRSYAEGGLTAHSWGGELSTSPTCFFTRLVIATLHSKRHQMLEDDAKAKRSESTKASTLVCEWSGANDLITATLIPTEETARIAVEDRKINVEKLIRHGYRHFVLFNLPDLACTPRFQAQGEAERENAHKVTEEFNKQLQEARNWLRETYPHCTIEIFDVNRHFDDIYNNPAKYGFDPEKKKEPYIESDHFTLKDGISPDPDHIFWDWVHPTSKVHKILADTLYDEVLSKQYDLVNPSQEVVTEETFNISPEQLLKSFKNKYAAQLASEYNIFQVSHINLDDLTLERILAHALYGDGARTLEVIKDLQWVRINEKGEIKLKLNIPALKEAVENLHKFEDVKEDFIVLEKHPDLTQNP